MKSIKSCTKLQELNFTLNKRYFTKETLFLDIETTGFSPSKNRCYLIGTARLFDGCLLLEQFFAENASDEPAILTSFAKLFAQFQNIVYFNGKAFDLPFLMKRMEKYGIHVVDDNKYYVDIFLFAASYKHIFHLDNYKQKTLENYLGIERDDLYTGGELIQIYHSYEKNASEEELHLLLQHNKEDLLGMIQLLDLQAYGSLFDGGFELQDIALGHYQNYEKQAKTELLIETILKEAIPHALSCRNEIVYCSADGHKMNLRIPVEEGILKYFYTDYKNYYYLPKEDMAIHKSIAAYVDKNCREKATKQTCYGKKDGIFLPQLTEFCQPVFYKQYQDKISYFEYTEDRNVLKQYCTYLLKTLVL